MKMKIGISMTLSFLVMLLVGCQQKENETTQQSVKTSSGATLLNFVEFEKSVDPYATRLIVTKKYMRFDDGESSKDFVLFDRQNHVIYSVNSSEATIMAVHQKQVDIKPPFKLELTYTKLDGLQDAPKIADKQAEHYQFSANGERCYDVIAVQGLMPDVVVALREFGELLASDSKVTFNALPADLQKPCDISMNTFAPGRHFQFGFPIQEWSMDGSGRSLLDYKLDYQPDPALFVLPTEYRQFNVQDFREGKVMPTE
jgi:hypothetical protein